MLQIDDPQPDSINDPDLMSRICIFWVFENFPFDFPKSLINEMLIVFHVSLPMDGPDDLGTSPFRTFGGSFPRFSRFLILWCVWISTTYPILDLWMSFSWDSKLIQSQISTSSFVIFSECSLPEFMILHHASFSGSKSPNLLWHSKLWEYSCVLVPSRESSPKTHDLLTHVSYVPRREIQWSIFLPLHLI